jgi:hypothetical protein
MNNGADAADQVVSMSLKGIEMLAKISGAGAKNLAAYLYAVLKDQKKTKGKTRLQSLLRSGKELKVFAVKNDDLKRFSQEANRYGVLYCALRDKKSLDGMCDIMVRAEDAPKINRIVERFKLATVDTASIKSEIVKSRAAKQEEKAPATKETPAEKNTDAFIDELMATPGPKKEPAAEQSDNPNPTTATTEKPRPSEPISERNGKAGEVVIEQPRSSVRDELREIRNSRKKEAEEPAKEPAKEKAKDPAKTSAPKAPAKSGRPKSKSTKTKPKER